MKEIKKRTELKTKYMIDYAYNCNDEEKISDFIKVYDESIYTEGKQKGEVNETKLRVGFIHIFDEFSYLKTSKERIEEMRNKAVA